MNLLYALAVGLLLLVGAAGAVRPRAADGHHGRHRYDEAGPHSVAATTILRAVNAQADTAQQHMAAAVAAEEGSR